MSTVFRMLKTIAIYGLYTTPVAVLIYLFLFQEMISKQQYLTIWVLFGTGILALTKLLTSKANLYNSMFSFALEEDVSVEKEEVEKDKELYTKPYNVFAGLFLFLTGNLFGLAIVFILWILSTPLLKFNYRISAKPLIVSGLITSFLYIAFAWIFLRFPIAAMTPQSLYYNDYFVLFNVFGFVVTGILWYVIPRFFKGFKNKMDNYLFIIKGKINEVKEATVGKLIDNVDDKKDKDQEEIDPSKAKF